MIATTQPPKFAPIAAFLNATAGVLILIVAVILIGPSVMADRSLFAELALRNPTPLILQDALKFISASIASVLIWAFFHLLSSGHRKAILVATLFGSLSVSLLLANAVLSLITTTQAASLAQNQPDLGNRLNTLIGLLAFAAIFANGPWYLLVSWSALKTGRLPNGLGYLGFVMGALSFLPPLGVIVLLLSIVWSVWLGMTWLRKSDVSAISIQEP